MIGFGKTTSGLNTINTSDVKKTRVMLPSLEMQKRWLSVVDRITGMNSDLCNASEIDDDIFDSIVYVSFAGPSKGY